MASLYELTGDYLQLMEMMSDPDMDPQTIADTMEGIDGEIEVKAENYAKIMKSLESDAKGIKAEEERLKKRRQTIENNIDDMKKRLQAAMEATEKFKFKTDLFSFGIQKNPPKLVMDEQYIENIPEEYIKYEEPTVNEQKIKEDLKAGLDLGGIAHLEQTQSLRIR